MSERRIFALILFVWADKTICEDVLDHIEIAKQSSNMQTAATSLLLSKTSDSTIENITKFPPIVEPAEVKHVLITHLLLNHLLRL